MKCPCDDDGIDREGALETVKMGVVDTRKRGEREMGAALIQGNRQTWSVGKRKSVCLKYRRWRRESGAERKRLNIHCRHQRLNNLHPC